jgi:TIR domain
MPGSSLGGIFLSYRREDAAPYARLLQFQLRERFPDARVFVDLDSIEAGQDFAEVIREAVDSSAVLVALIGRQWATLADDEGRRRLDNPDDIVRFEIQAALDRGVRMIPVLVDGAKPLQRQQLPVELHKLSRLNALELSYSRYEYDSGRLLDLIQRILALSAVRNDPDRAARLFADAEGIARSIGDEEWDGDSKVWALANVAQALAGMNLYGAARLFADAEGIAQSITSEFSKAEALASIACALAATDPDRAERIAQSITNEFPKDIALVAIGHALAATDPDRAERIAQSITDERVKAKALGLIVQVLAATDPDRAERIAQSITDRLWKAWSLAAIAIAGLRTLGHVECT